MKTRWHFYYSTKKQEAEIGKHSPEIYEIIAWNSQINNAYLRHAING